MWEGVYSSTRSTDTITTTVPAGATSVSGVLQVPEGFCWYVERMTCWSNTAAASPLLEVFVVATNQPPVGNDKAGRQDFASGSSVKNAVSQEMPAVYVGPGMFLVASWTGMTAADLVTASFQVRVHKLVNVQPPHRHGPRHGGLEQLLEGAATAIGEVL